MEWGNTMMGPIKDELGLEQGGVGCKLDFNFFLSIVRHASTRSECQQAETWPASTYGQLRWYLQRTPYLQVLYLRLTSSLLV